MPTIETTANVYLFEPPTGNIDIAPAAKYGTIQYLFKPERGTKSRSSLWETDKLAAEILGALADCNYDPATDYICISGHQVATSILLATVIAEYGAVKVLLFDTRERSYVARELGREFEQYD